MDPFLKKPDPVPEQLAWDPYQDAEAVMDDYYQRGFGNAADDIKIYWTMMEKAREEYMEMPGFQTGSRAKYDNVALTRQVYDSEFFKQADCVLKRAAAQVETEPEVYARRVAFVRSGFDFFRLVFESAKWMDLVRETKGADTQAVRQVSANWEKIERIAEESSPLGFRYSLIQSRMKGGYMGGMDVYFGPPSSEYREAAGLR